MARPVPQRGVQGVLERPRARRVFSHPFILLACLVGAVALIHTFDLVLSDAWGEILNDRGRSTYPLTVQNIMWLVFALGIGELIVRTRDAFAEQAAFEPEMRVVHGCPCPYWRYCRHLVCRAIPGPCVLRRHNLCKTTPRLRGLYNRAQERRS